MEVATFAFSEVCERFGIRREFLLRCVREQWVLPARPGESSFDREDVARIELIRELIEDFGVNGEAVPIILHLIDQLNLIRREIPNESRAQN